MCMVTKRNNVKDFNGHCQALEISSASETLTSDPRLRDEDPRVHGNPKIKNHELMIIMNACQFCAILKATYMTLCSCSNHSVEVDKLSYSPCELYMSNIQQLRGSDKKRIS